MALRIHPPYPERHTTRRVGTGRAASIRELRHGLAVARHEHIRESMNNSTLPNAKHIDLSAQYDCAASMTVVYFIACGLVHVARRFYRADMPTTGKIELYTIAPFPGAAYTSSTEAGWYASTVGEDWLRYVDEFNPSRVDAVAMQAIAAAEGSTYTITSLAMAQAARYAALEF